MSTLSPYEEREVTRFAMFDIEIIADLDEHWADEPACCRGDAVATVREVARCCGHAILHCDEHYVLEREAIERMILARGAICKVCFRKYLAPATFDDFLKVVAL